MPKDKKNVCKKITPVKTIYTMSDYISNDGIQTAIFGPPFWFTIHLVSFNYPMSPSIEQKVQFANWLLSVGEILPCCYCRENFPKNVVAATKRQSINVMTSRHTFSRFCYDLHDEVNQMLNKSSPPFEKVRDQFEVCRAKCLTEDQKSKLLRSQKELGCVRPAHNGTKAKCSVHIVPQTENVEAFEISSKCYNLQI